MAIAYQLTKYVLQNSRIKFFVGFLNCYHVHGLKPYHYFKTIQMRPIERIDNFLKLVDWNWLLYEKWKIDKEDLVAKKICYMTNPTLPEVWKQNPDQRIGQLLINLGLIDDSLERWVIEDSTILIDQGIEPEEVLYWTSMYNENSEILETPITRKVSTLTEEHIIRILAFMVEHGGRISPDMQKAFDNMLLKYKDVPEELPMAA